MTNMSKYILKPHYGDCSVVILGSSVKTIKKKLQQHWEDLFENEDEYDAEHVETAYYILDNEFENVTELMDYYNRYLEVFEDYSMEETN